jgi:hypothetical protein
MKKNILALLAVLIPLQLATLTGCSDECNELADLACEKAGEQSDECKKLRQRADSTSLDDKRICAKALAVVNVFTAKN